MCGFLIGVKPSAFNILAKWSRMSSSAVPLPWRGSRCGFGQNFAAVRRKKLAYAHSSTPIGFAAMPHRRSMSRFWIRHSRRGNAETGRGACRPSRGLRDQTGRATDASGVTNAAGRLVFEVSGSSCEGYTMSQRLVVRLDGPDEADRLLDFRVSTFEAGDGAFYRFVSRTFVNDRMMEDVRGAGGAGRRGYRDPSGDPGKEDHPAGNGARSPASICLHCCRRPEPIAGSCRQPSMKAPARARRRIRRRPLSAMRSAMQLTIR